MLTKVQILDEIINALSGYPNEGRMTNEAMIDFCNEQKRQIKSKAERAKEKAALKREESDKIKEYIYGLCMEDAQTAEEILQMVKIEGMTKAKVVNKLSALVREGLLVKEQSVVGSDKKRKVLYKLA